MSGTSRADEHGARPRARVAVPSVSSVPSGAVVAAETGPGVAVTGAEDHAMRRALELAAGGPAHGPNPRVGCVLLDGAGNVLGEGRHEGAGTPHAEVAALASARAAGRSTTGATAVVTLEPCRHTGRTGPCTRALVEAGVRRVVAAAEDPDPRAGGGAEELRAAGVDVVLGHARDEAVALTRWWHHAVATGRPFVTLKWAATLDGRVAAADGTSRWLTGAQARADVHRRRATADAVLVGTGTALVDDPWLTTRSPSEPDLLLPRQPLRVVLGERALPADARVLDAAAETLQLRTRDVAHALAELAAREVRHLWVEGGPTVAAAFLRAGAVDEVVTYLAPALLGSGPSAVGDLGARTVSETTRLELVAVDRLGGDVVVVSRPLAAPSARAHADRSS